MVDSRGTKEAFTEVTDAVKAPGKIDLIIKLSIKTHLPGYSFFESRKSLNGKPGYPFIITVDGQTVTWREDGQVETTPAYDSNAIRIPDGGKVKRYPLLSYRLHASRCLFRHLHRFGVVLLHQAII
jgi:hypothetical protein